MDIYCLLLAVDINNEGFASIFDDLVRTVVRLLQSSSYCILLYKDVGSTGEVATYQRFLSCMMIGWSIPQLFHRFLQPSYVSNLNYGVASAALEEFGRKPQGSAVYQFSALQ